MLASTTMQSSLQKESATEIFHAALKAVNPYESVKSSQEKICSSYETGHCNKLIVIGFGKASCAMTRAMEEFASDLIDSGIVITKYGHCPQDYKFMKIRICEAGHPVPDENGFKGTEEIIKLLKDADEDTLVVCLISGGGSALLVSPHEGITLHDKQQITLLLQKAGANINELNAVRKHISRVKGGRLAEIAYPAKVISLILSDVIGDRLDVIASGPTSPDKTTYLDAIKVIEKYKLTDKSPHPVIHMLDKGVKGLMPETPKEGNPVFEKIENIIIGSNKKAIIAAKAKAEELGFETAIISSEIQGEARDVGRWLAKKAMEMKFLNKKSRTICLISGGETTVTVKGNGKGGRNMELALAFSLEIRGMKGITLISAGTDGTDGPTDAAGAIVDGMTVIKAKTFGLDPEEYLNSNDSYNFFKKIDELFITGPTGTNVMDIQIVLIETEKR